MPVLRRTLIAVAALLCSLAVLWGGIRVWSCWCKAHWQEMPRALVEARTLRKPFIDAPFLDLAAALREAHGNTFDTAWDSGHGVTLSRSLFQPTDMFGQPRYRYLPDIGVSNVVVWSGLFFQGLALSDGDLSLHPALAASLARCQVVLDMHFTTDGHGFKPTGAPAAPDLPSVLFLGDSFTEGLWVAPEDTFVSRFGRRLAAAPLTATTYNLGVNGYGGLEMAWMLRRFAAELHARVAIADVFPNDVDADYVKVVQGDGIAPAKYAELFTELQRIRDCCALSGIRLLVVALPCRAQFEALKDNEAFQKRLAAWCLKHDVTCLDPRDDLRRAGVENVYLSWDPHFSARGHDVMAEFLWRSTAALMAETFDRPGGG